MPMNGYRITADTLHVLAVLCLLFKLILTKKCGAFSGKSQFLFLTVYTLRYLDLFTYYISAYNTIMKIFFILSHFAIVIMIFFIFRKTYRRDEDAFRAELLVVPCFLVSLWFGYRENLPPFEVLWRFSIYLESVAIIPQLYMIIKTRQVEKIVLLYLFLLGNYRLFYDFNWIYRYIFESHFDKVSTVGGIIYVSVYVTALILSVFLRVKIVDSVQGELYKQNIFIISHNDNEPVTAGLIKQEKEIASEQISPEMQKV